MKIKALAALCKKEKSITILDETDENGQVTRQWICCGTAVYPLDGMPEVTEDTILSVFDVPQSDRRLYSVGRGPVNNMSRYLADNEDADREATMGSMTIGVGGDVIKPIYTPYGLITIKAEMLKPVEDSSKTAQYFARELPTGTVIVVKNGFQAVATIVQYNHWAMWDRIAEELGDMSRLAARLEEKQRSEDA